MNFRNTLLPALAAALLTVACSGYGAPALPAAVGTWNMTIDTPLGTQEPTLVVTGDASGLAATMTSPEGDLEMREVTWNEDGTLGFTMDVDVSGQQMSFAFTGTVDGDSIAGSFASDFGDMEATATRVVE